MPLFGAGYHHQSMTPMASPRPMYQKPTILIQESARIQFDMDMSISDSDFYYYPTTPPLSASGSVMDSPFHNDILNTPLDTSFVENFEGVKEGCESEVLSESLAGDWTRSGSPPMTPVYVHERSSISVHSGDLLSATACPSLSPSPSPFQQQASFCEPARDFCDPRKLTVGASSTNASLTVAFSSLPALGVHDEDVSQFVLQSEPMIKGSMPAFDFGASAAFTSFDGLSDLDTDEDFVNGLVNFPASDNVHFFGAKRQRTTSDLTLQEHILSEDEFEDFEDAEQFAVACQPSPPSSFTESFSSISSELPTKRSKFMSGEDYSTDFDCMVRSRRFTVPINAAAGTPVQESNSEGQNTTSAAPSQAGSSDSNANAIGGSDAAHQHVSINRRGRKQSLTEDPSKTFVCDLCNRRFRRQEHLKRHYRSLHTHDKPFECHECGKKFSRSDNLSQHARTHGAGAIVMGVLEDGEVPHDHMGDGSEIRGLGKVLFEVAVAAPGSELESGSSSEGDSQFKKKRKRSD